MGGLQVVASGRKWLQALQVAASVASGSCKWLQMLQVLQVVASGCKWSQVVASAASGRKWLQALPVVASGCKCCKWQQGWVASGCTVWVSCDRQGELSRVA
jgi:hypothetical protein